MSNDIQTGKISPVVGNSTTAKPAQHDRSASPAESSVSQASASDTVSMTDQAARLKKFEAMLAEIPQVNQQLVAETRQAIADGSLDMDFEGTASRLMEMERANTGNVKS